VCRHGERHTECANYDKVFGQILVEFLFRLTLGVATAMCLTPSKWVTSGFYRVHLWVLLGVQTLAALALYSTSRSLPGKSELALINFWQFWFAVAAAAGSYIGAVIWMYEQRLAGKFAIAIVAVCAFAGCMLPVVAIGDKPIAMQLADRISGSLLLGLVTTAMLLGHWYLNTPTMKLQPLQRLIVLLGIAVVLRAAVCGAGTWLEVAAQASATGLPPSWSLFVTLRWLAGIAGVLAMAVMTWHTLKIPNTQSATGILYAGVILAFIGELTSQLLSAAAQYPV
jgi:hypothetical protein